MVPLAGGRPGVQPKLPKRPTMGWGAAGRSRRCRTCLAVSLPISQALCQQKSPPEEDHVERGQIGAHHARQGPLWTAGRGRRRFIFIKIP